MKNFIQQGDRIRYRLVAAVESGDPVIIGTGLLGIALEDGKIDETIDFAVEGVFDLKKLPAAVITAGEQVLWDKSANLVDDDKAIAQAGDFLCGYAWEAAGNGAKTVPVRINKAAPNVT